MNYLKIGILYIYIIIIRLFPYFIQERLGFDSNIFEQSYSDVEVQKRVFQTYSFFIRTGIEWKESKKIDYKLFQNFIASNLIFAQDEINILFNELCPEAEDFLDLYNEIEECENQQWPNENYFSEYLEYRNKPITSFNGFSTSKNN